MLKDSESLHSIQSCKTVLCPPKNYIVPTQPYPTQGLMTDKRNNYQTFV